MTSPLRKCFSLPSFDPAHLNSYTFRGNADPVSHNEFVVRDTGTTHLRVALTWHQFQNHYGAAPANSNESNFRLNREPVVNNRPLIHYLDDLVRLANNNGLVVILSLYSAFPVWSTGVAPGTTESGTGKPDFQHWPLNPGIDAPFGWFVGYLAARYNGRFNPTGPGEGGTGHGNPQSALAHAIETPNEPNHFWWPLNADAQCRAGTMIQTTEAWCRYFGGTAVWPMSTLGPATSDHDGNVDKPRPGGGTVRATADWHEFATGVCDTLVNFRPVQHTAWSNHNYSDIESRTTTRVDRLRGLLDTKNWLGQGSGHEIFLSEGTWRMTDYAVAPRVVQLQKQDDQAAGVSLNFSRMKSAAGVMMWSQHTINDVRSSTPQTDVEYGLRDDLIPPSTPGQNRKLYATWKNLTP